MLCLGFCLQCCLGQDLFHATNNFEEGKIYTITRADEQDSSAVYFKEDFVISFHQAKYDTFYETFVIESLSDSLPYKIKRNPPSKHWKYLKCLDKHCIGNKLELTTGLSVSEVPIEFMTVSQKDLPFIKDIKIRRMIQPAHYEFSNRKFESIIFDENEFIRVLENKEAGIIYFKFKAGHWKPWRDVVCSHAHHSCKPNLNQYLIRIQKRLHELGYYDGPYEQIQNTRFKAAMALFQRDHGIPIGNINIVTMKALDIID